MVERITRSGLLVRLGGLAAGAAGLGLLRSGTAPAAVGVNCVLTPEMTEGPYYIAGEKLRRNITEGRPGTRLDLRLAVADATTCRPIPNAAVDIWHADALGVYSGFGSGASSRTFMSRGGPAHTGCCRGSGGFTGGNGSKKPMPAQTPRSMISIRYWSGSRTKQRREPPSRTV